MAVSWQAACSQIAAGVDRVSAQWQCCRCTARGRGQEAGRASVGPHALGKRADARIEPHAGRRVDVVKLRARLVCPVGAARMRSYSSAEHSNISDFEGPSSRSDGARRLYFHDSPALLCQLPCLRLLIPLPPLLQQAPHGPVQRCNCHRYSVNVKLS